MLLKNQNKVNAAVLIASIISCFIAFYNKFPIVYPDTGTYIDTGYSHVVPADRPVFYGFFMYYLNMKLSLWPTVFGQAFLISYLNYLTLGMFFKGLKRSLLLLAITTGLSLFTGFSLHVSILIPDIFSAIVILSLINLLLNKNMGRLETLCVSIIFLFSLCTQFSSLSILGPFFMVLLLYLLYCKWKRRESEIKLKRFSLALFVFLSSLILVPTVNYALDGKFKLSGSNHVFFMNRLVETGILEEYLADACKTHNYNICAYKDSVGWDFIWSPESALNKTGGWEANREEYYEIFKDVFSKKRFILMFALKSVENSFKQFFAFQVFAYPPMLSGTAPFEQIEWHYKHVYREYFSSLQSNGKLNFNFINQSQLIFVLLGMFILFSVISSSLLRKALSKELRWAVLLFLLHNIINSVMCANLSTTDDRYQSRLVWMYPFFATLVLIQLTEYFKKNKGEGLLRNS